MQNSFGTEVVITLFGESHGPMIGAVLDGLPAGFDIDEERIAAEMDRRRASGAISTARQEPDRVSIVSGLFEGKTTGTALTLLIENTNTRSSDYTATHYRLRPGHADYTAFVKYQGYQDYRGGGHFSGRLTAALTAAGSICSQILESFGIYCGCHIQKLASIEDDSFSEDPLTLLSQFAQVKRSSFPVLNRESGEKMKSEILAAREELDSVGGIISGAVIGLPPGLGEPFFDSVESALGHLFFSIPAVKGVSFGSGFACADMRGSQMNDPFIIREEVIQTLTNHNGGINGGITNGMPVTFSIAVKPTPSIYRRQDSVDYQTRKPVSLEIHGRHDPAIIHRACPVVDAMASIGILDLYVQRYGRLLKEDAI